MKKLLPLLLLAFWIPTHADTSDRNIRYTFEGTLSAPFNAGSAASLGDSFTLQFDMDLDSVSRHSANQADYPITNLTFSLGPNASGDYAGGHITGSMSLTLYSFPANQQLVFSFSSTTPNVGASFAAANGLPFFSFRFNLEATNTNSFTLQAGQDVTLRNVFSTLDIAHFDTEAEVHLQFWTGTGLPASITGTINNISVAPIPDGSAIPEPSTYAAFAGIAVLGVTLVIRKRNRRNS